MKEKDRTMRHFVLTLLFLMTLTVAQGQVVMGSDLQNERAAILDLKNQEANTANTTTTEGGLLLPRVALVSPNTLEPFVSTTDLAWTDSAQKERLTREHIGLEVYNVTTSATLKPGTYLWNGTLWERLFKDVKEQVLNRITFPLPAFNLPLINPNDIEKKRLTVDLYQVYSNNRHHNNFITTISNKSSFLIANVYKADEMDYVVTHYDNTVITIHSISNTGIMDYTVHNINPESSSFLNIYLVVHEGKEKK